MCGGRLIRSDANARDVVCRAVTVLAANSPSATDYRRVLSGNTHTPRPTRG